MLKINRQWREKKDTRRKGTDGWGTSLERGEDGVQSSVEEQMCVVLMAGELSDGFSFFVSHRLDLLCPVQ